MASDHPARLLRGTELRYTLTRLLQLLGRATIADLISGLRHWNFRVEGRPSKTVSDALRWEMEHGRVWRVGRGVYRIADMPRSTEHRIVRRVEALREEARPSEAWEEGKLSLGGGQQRCLSVRASTTARASP